MTLQELVDYYDNHPEQQKGIRANNGWEYWNMEFDEMIEKFDEKLKKSTFLNLCFVAL